MKKTIFALALVAGFSLAQHGMAHEAGDATDQAGSEQAESVDEKK